MRRLLAAVGLAVVAAGCGGVTGPQASSRDFKLYEAASTQSAQLVAVIDSRSHAIERRLPFGTPSPDWQHLYSVSSNLLMDTDPAGGATLKTLKLPGDYRLPPATISGLPGGLSQNGQWLVLERFEPASTSLPSASHMVVVGTSFARQPVRIDLTGFFEFDAISNDGQRLYLIEHVSPTIYRVRMFNVGAGQLDPSIVFDKSDGSQAMAGLRLSGVASPDGHSLYSMYVRDQAGPFVHALSLDGPIAFCIDLPGSGYNHSGDGSGFHWSLALSAGGSRLYAVNAATGIVSEIDTGSDASPKLLRSAHIGAIGPTSGLFAQDAYAKGFGANPAVLSPDGRTLVTAGASGVVWIDTATLHARGHALTGWRVWSLALSPDGMTVYALSDAGKIAELSMAAAQVAVSFEGAAGQPMALIRVEAAAP